MTAPSDKWSQSNAVVSIEDLQGAQAIIYLPFNTSPAVDLLWRQMNTSLRVTLYLNHQRIQLEPLKAAGSGVVWYQDTPGAPKPYHRPLFVYNFPSPLASNALDRK